MSDPIDDVITDVVTPPAAPTVPEGQVMISQEELDRLRGAESQLTEVAPILNQFRNNPQAMDDARFRTVADAPPAPKGSQFNWEDPDGSTARIARDAMAGEAMAINEKLARMTIQNFLMTKTQDPFYNVVKPMFEREVYGMNMAQLGGLPDQSLQLVLQKAWNSNVGEWSSRRATEKKNAAPPVNLGGGGGAAGGDGGPKDVKHLSELDAEAYAFALAAGMSEEDMAELAAQLQ